jgi:hypothetical protein
MWSCKHCGMENDPSGATCAGCASVRQAWLRLTFGATGREATIRVSTVYGQSLLRTLGGDDARFAAERQFSLDKTAAGWVVTHDPEAKNPTCLNGAPLDAPTPLQDGASLSIGPTKMPITIHFEYP